jgi:hypothetical protein
MAEQKEIERASSPASRGGAGVYIEGELGAYYLLALLAGTEARGMRGVKLTSVRFQGVDQGFAMDDLILEGSSSAGDALLEIQSKRDIGFSPRDVTFAEVVAQVARSQARNVPEDRHLLAVATQRQSKSISGPYQDVLIWARAAESGRDFFNRVEAKGVGSDPMRTFVATFRANLLAAGIADDDDVVWKLIRRFAILVFDFESTAPLARLHALALARQVLADEDVSRAESLWSGLIEISIAIGKVGGSIGREELRSKLLERGYLREIDAERDIYKVKAIRQFSATLVSAAPAELADLIANSLIEKRPRKSRNGLRDNRAFSHVDADYLPASPAQPPFLDLLLASPEHGLALVRRLVSAAIEIRSDAREAGDNGFTVVFDDGARFFPWTHTYFWSRDQASEYSAASGLKALEAWGHSRRSIASSNRRSSSSDSTRSREVSRNPTVPVKGLVPTNSLRKHHAKKWRAYDRSRFD